MFGLVCSAFPKPPNTTDIQTEMLPAPPPPPCPRSKGLALPARPSGGLLPAHQFAPPSPISRCPGCIPLPIRDGQAATGLRKS